MKSKPILILILLISLNFYGQTEKGHFLIAGSSNLSLSFISTDYSNSTSNQSQNSKITNFTLSPVAGYFVSDDLALGLLIYYSNTSYANKTSSVLAGPFMRYYFSKSDKFYPFLQASLDYGSNSYKFTNYDIYGTPAGIIEQSSAVWGGEIDLGLSFLLSKQVSFDILAGYTYLKETIPFKDFESYQTTGAFGINLGVSVFLGKNHEEN